MIYLNELHSRINVEDVAKRNNIKFLIELLLALTVKYFSKQKLFRKKQRLAEKPRKTIT